MPLAIDRRVRGRAGALSLGQIFIEADAIRLAADRQLHGAGRQLEQRPLGLQAGLGHAADDVGILGIIAQRIDHRGRGAVGGTGRVPHVQRIGRGQCLGVDDVGIGNHLGQAAAGVGRAVQRQGGSRGVQRAVKADRTVVAARQRQKVDGPVPEQLVFNIDVAIDRLVIGEAVGARSQQRVGIPADGLRGRGAGIAGRACIERIGLGACPEGRRGQGAARPAGPHIAGGVEQIGTQRPLVAEFLLELHHGIVADGFRDQVGILPIRTQEVVLGVGQPRGRRSVEEDQALAGRLQRSGFAGQAGAVLGQRGHAGMVGIGPGPRGIGERPLAGEAVGEQGTARVPGRAGQEAQVEILLAVCKTGIAGGLDAVKALAGDEVDHAGDRVGAVNR